MDPQGIQLQERRGFEVGGHVQGVGFRASTRRFARRLELRGWVYNRPDGAVEVHARGKPNKLEKLKQFLQRGPPGAEVEALEEIPPETGLPKPFEVLA